MTTFSQLVDDVMAEIGRRREASSTAASYLNQTLREVHFDNDQRPILFHDNSTEAQIVADSDTFYWDVPDTTCFQAMEAVQFASIRDHITGEGIYAPERRPGRGLVGVPAYYYRGGTRYIFSGYGGDGGIINLSYFEYPETLKYYESDARPAEYDPVTGWSYAAGIVTPEDQETAREMVSNWLLLRWGQFVSEGLRAKMYKRASDDARARMSYSLYQQLKEALVNSEALSPGGYS